jgi:integrase
MPKPRAAKLETATARRRLEVRKKPFWTTISPGIGLGYRRNAGPGTWSARSTNSDGADWIKRIGLADDLEPADGKHVLTYWQAVDVARALARRQPGADDAKRPVTVSEALDRYQRDLKSRGADAQNANRVRKHLTPTLATKPVALLTMDDLLDWRDGLVTKGVAPATINRTRAGLRAALELAASLDDRITNRNAFRSGLKGLPGGKNARRVVLPDADVLRIVEAAYQENRAFGILIEVLAQTGARVSQAARLRCADLQAARADPRLLMPTSYKGRGQKEKQQQVPAPITATLAALLVELKGDRPDDAPLLSKSDGSRWLATNKSEQWGIFREVAERAGFDPDVITCYALRHSSICRALLNGVPVSVVARLHDTSSREIEAHYAAYILDVAGDALSRKGLLRPEATSADNVVPLSAHKG